jgi:hypothetical protein
MPPPRRGGNSLVVAGTLAVLAAAAAYPVLYALKAPKPSLGNKPLNGDATIRGAYVNAGSRDVGPDPDAARYAKAPK